MKTEGKKINKIKKTQNIYAAAVVLNYIKHNHMDKYMSEPAYFREELAIGDFRIFLRKLINGGYIVKDKNVFKVTDKGERFILKYADYIDFFETATIYADITEYQDKKEELRRDKRFEAVMISLLLQKIIDFEKKDDVIAVKNIHVEVGDLYNRLEYKGQALYHYLVALYFEVNGLEFYESFLKYINNQCTKIEFEESYVYIYIDPYIINAIASLGEIFYDEMADAVYKKNQISINMCTREKFKDMVEEIISGTFDREKWQGYFHTGFKALVKAAENQK